MSTKEAISTMTTTVSSTGATLASSPKLDVEAEDDEEEPSTTFDALDMDLVNGPNPWLPAYGFQLQHRSHFQPTHEDLRTNGSYSVCAHARVLVIVSLSIGRLNDAHSRNCDHCDAFNLKKNSVVLQP